MTMTPEELRQRLRTRYLVQTDWIAANAPHVVEDQLHCEPGEEKNYWTYGYASALKDVLKALGSIV